ncbi:hypothetical protein B5F27_15765, partial [Faecalibacterium sp. An192]
LLLLIAPKQKNFCVTKDRVPLRGPALTSWPSHCLLYRNYLVYRMNPVFQPFAPRSEFSSIMLENSGHRKMELFCGSENQAMRQFASYRAAGTNAGNEPERNGPAELPETRKRYGTH